MSLLQISEPNQSPAPHARYYALGIDLGTTNSLVAAVQSGKPFVLPIDGQTTMPSVVAFHQGKILVGQQAREMADIAPQDTIISAKRFMGRKASDIKFSHAYTLVGDDDLMPDFVTSAGNVSPVSVSAHILQKLVTVAKAAFDGELAGVVITVPAYFDDAQRQATLDAASACAIKVLRLLNEPTAAALAYGMTGKTVLVYDLGGGTFDVSLLKASDGVFDVQATGGNSSLGGDDIDRLLGNFFIKQAGIDPATLSGVQKSAIARAAKHYKHELSKSELVSVSVPALNLNTSLSRQELRQIIRPVLERTLVVCQQVLNDSGVDKSAIDEVILVGGSTRMPLVQEVVAQFFGKSPRADINPDEVVAMGAGILADQLLNKSQAQVLLLDVTPLSLGLETMGGLTEVIIPRNTPIPIKKRNEFTTHTDGQTGMAIHVVQGERETAADCRSLARFELFGIPPLKAGMARVEVTFAIDVNGKLTVAAQEVSTGVQASINVVPSGGLSVQQQEALLKDGFSFAEQDKAQRMLIESTLAGESELKALTQALMGFSHLLTDDEKSHLTQAMEALKNALASADKAQIDAAKAALKPSSDYFAELIMNQNVKSALTGTALGDWR